MTILGIDPGIARLGYAILEVDERRACHVITYGCFETKKTTPQHERLKAIYDHVSELLKKYSVTRLVIEKLFFAKNVTNAFVVGEARGVVMLAAAQAHLEIIEIAPNSVKQSLTGFGGAGKIQMQNMVRMIFKLKEVPKPDDAADALAIAYAGSLARF